MSRTLVSLLGVLVLLIVGVIPAGAYQVGTPESGLADLGLPELAVTATAAGYDGIPESVEAGRYLVTLTAAEDTGEFGAVVGFIQPSGMSAEEFLTAFGGPTEGAAEAATEGTPAEGEEDMGGPPAAMFDSTYAGGIGAMPGQPAEIVLDLPPGEWIAWAEDPEAAQEPVVFEVTGEMPADLAEPESSATITMGEYVIEVSEGELTAGSRVIAVENVGAQPHYFFGALGPDDLTEAQIGVALDEELAAGDTGTPPVYSDFNPDEDISDDGFLSGTQSTGITTWIAVDLDPGTYILACFFPDVADGMPHAYHGMYTVIEVAE